MYWYHWVLILLDITILPLALYIMILGVVGNSLGIPGSDSYGGKIQYIVTQEELDKLVEDKAKTKEPEQKAYDRLLRDFGRYIQDYPYGMSKKEIDNLYLNLLDASKR